MEVIRVNPLGNVSFVYAYLIIRPGALDLVVLKSSYEVLRGDSE